MTGIEREEEYDKITVLENFKSPYERWKQAEGLPTLRGYFVENLAEVKLTPWKSRGGSGIFINLEGTGGYNDAYIHELGPKEGSARIHHIYEETIFVLHGRGATSVWIEEGNKQTFEWQERSVFAIPPNAWHQHFNLSGEHPARIVALTAAPAIINQHKSLDFVFNNPYVFSDRFNGDSGYFQETERPTGERPWATNFVADVLARAPLAAAEEQDPPKTKSYRTGLTTVNQTLSVNMINGTVKVHTSSWPVGTYKPGHRHGPGTHVLILRGRGYSLMWPEGEPAERIEWGPGSMLVPPEMWFHQHFNLGTEPVFFLALHHTAFKPRPNGGNYATYRSMKEGGDRIFYADEDPVVHRDFEAALAQAGVTCRMGGVHPLCSQRLSSFQSDSSIIPTL